MFYINIYLLYFKDFKLLQNGIKKLVVLLNEKNNLFLNIESNLIFWKKWYKFCESFLGVYKDDEINIVYDKYYGYVFNQIRFKYENLEEEMWVGLSLLIKELRKEWEIFILLKKQKEFFYWSFLYELENIIF